MSLDTKVVYNQLLFVFIWHFWNHDLASMREDGALLWDWMTDMRPPNRDNTVYGHACWSC